MAAPTHSISLPRLVLKTLLLFLLANILLVGLDPLPTLGRISLYNKIFPGRVRLPYGEEPDLAYNLSLFSLEAMFASHEVAAPRQANEQAGEYRVLLIGDSSTWGFLLHPEDTLSAQLNRAGMQTPAGKRVRFYNLGYPTMSLTKDLLLLQRGMDYQPDLVIWLLTLESMPLDKQLDSPIVQHNPQAMRPLIETYALPFSVEDDDFVHPSLLDRTLVGQRRALADVMRLQVYGVLWAATGIDQNYPPSYDPPQEDLSADLSFHDLQPPTLHSADLAFDVLEAGAEMVADIPILFVNEPMYISRGENSHIRYNFFYPRWAYDQYRRMMQQECQVNGWSCLDLWDLVPPGEYTNSAIHLTPAGEAMLAERLLDWLGTFLHQTTSLEDRSFDNSFGG
jgi:hypothetical protein